MARKRLGQLLVEAGLLSEEQLTHALREQKARQGRLGELVAALGLLSEEQIAQTLSNQLGIPFVDLAQTAIEPQAVELIPERVARKHLIVPISLDQRELQVAMADPLSFEAVDDVRFASGFTIKPCIATRSAILWAIEQHYNLGASLDTIFRDIAQTKSIEVVRDIADRTEGEQVRGSEWAAGVRMLNLIVSRAVEQGASDIHVEPGRTCLLIRNRVDGQLRKTFELPKWVQGAVVSRIKIMAALDIAEKRLPQDGRIAVRVGDKRVDLRVATMPAAHGEKIVIRLLDPAAAQMPLERLGLGLAELRRLEDAVRQPQGIVLVTGPTGSGKTTTLYGLLQRLRNEARNLSTLEDPVEYELEGVNQVAIQQTAGMTFAAALRAMLRQDPDVIMVGEMRDLDTATVAMHAALTGHQVLSTMHTNSAVATVTRLVNLGIPAYVVASAVSGIVAQRLVRMVCSGCRRKSEVDAEKLRLEGLLAADEPLGVWRGEGCQACGFTGYRGRIGVYEVLPFTPRIRDLVASRASEQDLRRAALAEGMTTLARGALEKVKAGVTTLEELFRVADFQDEGGVSVCPSCRSSLESDFCHCPRCGVVVRPKCEVCDRDLAPEWRFCPACGRRQIVDGTEGIARRRQAGA